MPREWILTPEERHQIAIERMSLGSIKGRVRSAAPVRPKPAALVPRLVQPGALGDTQRLYAEGDNYGSPIVLSSGGAATEIPWIKNVDQVGTDIAVESSGAYADIGILFNTTGLYSLYVHLECDGDFVGGESGVRQFWLEKGEHIVESYNSGGPDFTSANVKEAVNAVAFDVTCWDRTWLFWMEAGERTLVDARTYGDSGSVTVSRSVLVGRRLS